MNNKKIKVLLIGLLLIGLLLIGISFCIFILYNISKDNKVKEKVSVIAEKFYEETYYQTINKDILKEFTENGIIISLEELIEYEEEAKEDYKEYDMSKSNIKIYPKKPYNKEDYIIKIKLYQK